MDTNRWKSVAIRRDIVGIAEKIGKMTERPTSNVIAFAVKRLEEDIERLSRKKKVIETSFLDVELTQDQIKENSEELEKILSSLEQKEERWLELSMKLEG